MGIGTDAIEQHLSAVKYNEGIYTTLDIHTTGDLTVDGDTNIAGITLTDLTVSGNTIIGNAGTDTLTVTGDSSFADTVTLAESTIQEHGTTAAINATATATATEVATGYITSTSGAATTITLPTGTLLGAELGAVQGTVHELYIDNTAGANTVTIAVAVNGILSTAAADTAGSFGDLTVASGVTGVARYTLMFSSATAYVFTRTA